MIWRRLLPGLMLGLAAGLTGVLLTIAPVGLDLEESFGLDGLFLWRGARPVPPEVVIVTLDKTSARRFNLPNEARKWPRQLHARLVENLSLAGASVVGFDIHFEEPRDPVQDAYLTRAIQAAGNVVLFEYLKKEAHPLINGAGESIEVVTESLIPPMPAMARAATATAPFPLPKVPVKVSQYWLFKEGAGDPPTMPVVMFQLYAQATYPDLRHMLQDLTPGASDLPQDIAAVVRDRKLRDVMEQLRLLIREPEVSARLLTKIDSAPDFSELKRRQLSALTHVYRDRNSRYLNYYGPPRSITTIPFFEVWQAKSRAAAEALDMRGKIVLVGFSEHLQPEQKDGFYTVYSQEASGLDISGVEIAATALANMIEDNPVQVLPMATQLTLILMWGLLIGIIVMWRRVSLAIAVIVGLSLLYLSLALRMFSTDALWLPLVVPLAIQMPTVLFAGLLWHYRDATRERNRIRQAFRNYLPERAVAALARDLSAVPGGELMHGVCLATDAARYTALAERTAPEELASLMNRYYQALFQPVHAHGGFVSDVVGDAMLAVWAQVKPDAAQRAHACSAALDVAQTAQHFSQSLDSRGLATRIGLHAGPILLGNIGTTEHFEYRAVGDIVNTASRLQALNKILGTSILASRETTDGLSEFRVRELGLFRLPGKNLPTAVVELRGLISVADASEDDLIQRFRQTLREFSARRFSAAHSGFAQILERYPLDGPSRYYLNLSERYLAQPPEAAWDGVVRVAERANIRGA